MGDDIARGWETGSKTVASAPATRNRTTVCEAAMNAEGSEGRVTGMCACVDGVPSFASFERCRYTIWRRKSLRYFSLYGRGGHNTITVNTNTGIFPS